MNGYGVIKRGKEMLNHYKLLGLVGLGLSLIGSEPTIAQSIVPRLTNLNDSIAKVSFKPPPNDGKPDNTLGAGSRNDWRCQQTAKSPANTSANTPPLMALVPPTTNYGLTLAERPTLLVYLPKTSAKQVVLSIREEGTHHHSQTLFSTTGESGIFQFKPPDTSPALEIGKNYQWAVVLVCGEKPGPNDPAIVTWIRRVNPSSLHSAQIDRKTALEKAMWYGKQGIWYDTLATLTQARQAQPDNKALIGIWIEFLQSEGFGVIATEPLQF
jgi:hypothetical protein